MKNAQLTIELMSALVGLILVAVVGFMAVTFLSNPPALEETAQELCTEFSISDCNRSVVHLNNQNFPCYWGDSNSCIANTDENRCFSDLNCGESHFFGTAFCGEKNVYQKFETNSCSSGFCIQSIEDNLITACENQCIDGNCIECRTDSDCGADGFTGGFFCDNESVYRKFVANSCVDNSCTTFDENRLVETCSATCVNGECRGVCSVNSDCGTNVLTGNAFCWNGDVSRNRANYSCVAGSCHRSDETTVIEECEFGCSDANCLAQCDHNSECGTSGFTGENFCSNGDLYKKFVTPYCENNKCKSTDENRLITDCAGTCVAGSCQCVLNSDCNSNSYCDSGSCVKMDPNYFCGHEFTTPGTYALQGDIRNADKSACKADGLVIKANDVFIDCNHYRIIGIGGGNILSCPNWPVYETAGIHGNPCNETGVTGGGVKNCDISGVFRTGIYYGIHNGLIENNSIQNLTYNRPSYHPVGIFLLGASSEGTTIRNNTLSMNNESMSTGILNDEAAQILIENNKISKSTWGIWTMGRALTDFDIKNNEVFESDYGILSAGLMDSEVSNNSVHDNKYGFFAAPVSGYNISFHGNTLRNNTFNNNQYGFAERSDPVETNIWYCKDATLGGSFQNCYENDIDTSNTINGKPIYYYTPAYRMPASPITGADIGYFSCAHCDGTTLENVKLNQGNFFGAFFYDSSNTLIRNSEISKAEYAVAFTEADSVGVTSSNLHDNAHDFFLENFSNVNCNDTACPSCNVNADCGQSHATLFCTNTIDHPCQSSEVCRYFQRTIPVCQNHVCGEETQYTFLQDCSPSAPMCYNNTCTPVCYATPAGPEICDGVDNDCDMLIDDNCA